MGRHKPPVDLTIIPDGFTPDVDIFIQMLRGKRGENDLMLINWFETEDEESIKKYIREILSEMSLSEKHTSTVYENLERRLASQSTTNYSKDIMDKIMIGFRAAIENTIDGVRG